jgi:hypothetical protein
MVKTRSKGSVKKYGASTHHVQPLHTFGIAALRVAPGIGHRGDLVPKPFLHVSIRKER